METNINAILQCRAIPVLLLHGKAYNDNHPPNTLACHFNERNLHLPKFNCPNNGENIVHELRKETKSDYFSCLDGKYILCLTSFQESTSDQEHDNLMKSILRANDEEESVVAIPLTVRILQDAIKWLKGTSTIPLENVGTDTLESSVTTSVTTYLESLYDVFPAGTDVPKLRKFIDDHQWPVGSVAELKKELEKKESDEGKYYLLRGFIHRNLARMTKVVAHFVDGNHRAAALNCALTGSGDDVEGKRKYYENSPHNEQSVVAVIIVPDSIDADFAGKMRTISRKSQKTSCQQQSHTVREKISYAIEIVRKQCVGQGIGYLWVVLGYEMKKDVASGNMTTTLQNGEYSCFEKYEKCVSEWIGEVSQQIEQVVRNSDLHLLNDVAPGKVLSNLFKNKTKPSDADYVVYHIFPFPKSNMLDSFLKNHPDDVFRETRFSRTGFKDRDLIIVQILLWSMTSHEANQCLRLLFSNSNPTVHQLLPAGSTDNKDVALKWTMSFFHNVIESVYNSYAPWKKSFFISDPNMPIQCLRESVIYLCLLTSAIHECASFFMEVGLHPECPAELAEAIENIKMKREGENLSLVTLYTKLHSLSMNRIIKGNDAVSKKRYVTHWKAYYQTLNLGRNQLEQIKEVDKCVVRRRDKSVRELNFLLNILTVGGQASPDPRAKSKNGKKFVQIIGCNVRDVDFGVEPEPYFTTQICQFREILPKDTKLLESFKVPSKKQLPNPNSSKKQGAETGGRGGRDAPKAPGASAAVDGADGKSAGPPQEIVEGRGTDGTLAGGSVNNATKGPTSASPAADGILDGADGKSAGPPQRDTGKISRDRGVDGAFPKKTRSQNVNRKNNISESKKKNVNPQTANVVCNFYLLVDFWKEHVVPLLGDNLLFVAEKKLIEDALARHVSQIGPNTLCQICGKDRTEWSPYCVTHVKLFTEKYQEKPSKPGVMGMVKKLISQDAQTDDEQRARLAEIQGRGADDEPYVDFDAPEEKDKSPPRQNPFVLDEAAESISTLAAASNFSVSEFASINGDQNEGNRKRRKKCQTSASLSSFDNVDDEVCKGLLLFNNMNETGFVVCDWASCGKCIVCGPKDSLIQCSAVGCGRHLHKQCQTEWEAVDTSRGDPGDWCTYHHPASILVLYE